MTTSISFSKNTLTLAGILTYKTWKCTIIDKDFLKINIKISCLAPIKLKIAPNKIVYLKIFEAESATEIVALLNAEKSN